VTYNVIQCRILISERDVIEPTVFLNHICDPSLIKKVLKQKKKFFVTIRPAQKYESLGSQTTWDSAFERIYFLLRRVYQTPSSVRSFKSHLSNKAELLT
jgi:hypothetical protein